MVDYIAQLKQRILKVKISDIYNLLLHLIILTAPIIIYGASVFNISLRLSRIFIILILPILFLKIKTKPGLILRDKFLIFGVLPYLFFTTLSILWTPTSAISFGLNRLAVLYEVMLVYVLLIVADLNVLKFQSMIKSYLASALVPLAVAYWQIVNNLIHFSIPEVPFQFLLIPGKYEDFRDRFFMSDGGYTRITSCFAEPTIFGTFMSSILLLSLLVETKDRLSTIALRCFQFLVFFCLLVSLSKLAIVTFAFGIILILRKKIKYLICFSLGSALFLGMLYVVFKQHLHFDFVTRRFLTDSGHFALIKLSLKQIMHLNGLHMIFGNGIGSIPEFSTNKFLLSRIYESGIVGLLFALYVSILPFQILFQKAKTLQLDKIQNICFGVICSVLIGFHLYDDFIYLWPWIIIGSIMSFHYNKKYCHEDC